MLSARTRNEKRKIREKEKHFDGSFLANFAEEEEEMHKQNFGKEKRDHFEKPISVVLKMPKKQGNKLHTFFTELDCQSTESINI